MAVGFHWSIPPSTEANHKSASHSTDLSGQLPNSVYTLHVTSVYFCIPLYTVYLCILLYTNSGNYYPYYDHHHHHY